MSELSRLRDEARKRRAAVTNKISRTRRQAGAEISGTQFDPRRNAGVEKRYTKAQLQRYLSDLNSFMSRGNQYVAGTGGAPLPRGQFNRYKRLEAEVNAAGARHEASIGSVQTPIGLTVRQSKAMIPTSQGSAVYGPYRKFDRDSTDIPSAEALESLARDMLRKVSSGFLGRKISEGRENLKKALTVLGETQYVRQVDELSDYQFDVMWYGTTIAESIFMQYGIEKERAAGTKKERWQDKVVESAANELGSVLEWASNDIPRERPR
jgi:hypothetical protein